MSKELITRVETGAAHLSSYHTEHIPSLQEAYRRFEAAGAQNIHPPEVEFKNPTEDINVFVVRQNDPEDIPHHLLQWRELRRMLDLKKFAPGRGFGYVVNEDSAIGMHTAGEVAYLALKGIPNVSSRNLEGFRNIPLYAQDTLKKAVRATLPLDDITPDRLEEAQEYLATLPGPSFNGEERRILNRLVMTALWQQKYEERLHPILLTSDSDIKREALITQARIANPGRAVLLDPVKTSSSVPEQPFQQQGIDGAHARVDDALAKTKGFDYKEVGSFENAIVALDRAKFNPGAWATKDRWATPDQIASRPNEVIYADVACFVYRNMTTGETQTAFSKPVVIPRTIAEVAMGSGGETLYANVLRSRDSSVNPADPQSYLTNGAYSRRQQLADVTASVLSRR